MKTDILAINGMECEMCVKAVVVALQGLDGVQSAQVSLDEKRAVVSYDPDKTGLPEMVAAIAEEGYEAVPALQC